MSQNNNIIKIINSSTIAEFAFFLLLIHSFNNLHMLIIRPLTYNFIKIAGIY